MDKFCCAKNQGGIQHALKGPSTYHRESKMPYRTQIQMKIKCFSCFRKVFGALRVKFTYLVKLHLLHELTTLLWVPRKTSPPIPQVVQDRLHVLGVAINEDVATHIFLCQQDIPQPKWKPRSRLPQGSPPRGGKELSSYVKWNDWRVASRHLEAKCLTINWNCWLPEEGGWPSTTNTLNKLTITQTKKFRW